MKNVLTNGAAVQKYFVCANPHSLEVARTDSLFREAIEKADLVVPDGIGIVLASKILGGSIRRRITGYDIFYGVSKELNKKKSYFYFVLGSTEKALQKIRERMEKDFPNIRIVGTYSPPFKSEFSEEENRLILEMINKVKPDVLWVGMTAPKQEKWIYKNKDKLDVKFLGPIGAVFDFYAGIKKRPHPVFQKMGLEWFVRFLMEPYRLWRRNIVSNPKFLLRIIHQYFSQSEVRRKE
ncbi:MAG: glycosyltransferase [Thermodesulfovibrio aggregans]|uniref:Glycosyltransferase n=1 Tax=Thermodesulfovibrio aggregans TaxID=86166 RepID=A0A2J6WGN8_9BACT|nr:MAG: glycosyltransferase [Thermodesulfovibrio aggregans]